MTPTFEDLVLLLAFMAAVGLVLAIADALSGWWHRRPPVVRDLLRVARAVQRRLPASTVAVPPLLRWTAPTAEPDDAPSSLGPNGRGHSRARRSLAPAAAGPSGAEISRTAGAADVGLPGLRPTRPAGGRR